ncbi:MAG: phosphotransferase family protein [Paracoccaceae bacterium]|nr:phosphotransferase family protein [Paracoccaceae bacterium]
MTPYDKARELPIWRSRVDPQPLGGGITNVNFLVSDGARRAVVRIGGDIPVHQILRFNELAASRAAHAAGVSPAVLYHEPGALVIDYVDGKTLSAEDLRSEAMLARVVPLVRRAHQEVPRHLRGPALVFWVFHVIRDYAARLHADASNYAPSLPDLLDQADRLERAVGPVELVYGHNDMLAANFIDDGARLWLIDWDYAGFNSPLFDLGGLAANNGFSEAQERWLLEAYFERPADVALWHRYQAMKCAAALRECLWSMVSELHSDIDFDFAAYTARNLASFRAALSDFQQT